MKKFNEIHIGAILSYIDLGIGSIIPLIYTPIMLRILGQNEYGIYSLATSLTSYLSLLNFGLGSAVIRYISKYRTEKNKEGEESIIGLFIFIYVLLSLMVCVVGLIIVISLDSFFANSLSNSEMDKLKILIFILTINVAIGFPGSVLSSVIISHEKFIFRKVVDLSFTILIPVFNLLVLSRGWNTIGMVLCTTIFSIVMLIINVMYLSKIMHIKPNFKNMPLHILKEIAIFSFFIFIGSIVDMLYWSTDKVLIGSMIGTSAVAIYSVGGTFNNMVQQLAMALSGVLVPKVNSMVFNKSSNKDLSDLLIKTGRLQYIIVSLTVSGFIVFGRQFIKFIAGEGYESAYIVALLTMVPLIIPLIQNIALNIIVAKNKHRFRSILYLIVAIVNVLLTIVAIKYGGIVGAALCTCIAFCIGNIIIMNVYYYKVIKLDICRFWKNIISMSYVPIAMIFLGLCLINNIGINTISRFIIGVIIYTLVFAIMTFKFSMNKYEKDIFLKPIKNISSKFLNLNSKVSS